MHLTSPCNVKCSNLSQYPIYGRQGFVDCGEVGCVCGVGGFSGVPTGGAGGAARPGCHSLRGDTQSMDQYLRNDTNGTQLSLLVFELYRNHLYFSKVSSLIRAFFYIIILRF